MTPPTRRPRPAPVRGLSTLLALVLASCATGRSEPSAAAEPVHLFVLSGQSNMARLDPGDSFTPRVRAALGSENVLVVHDAHGGQPIHRWDASWRSSSGERAAPCGDLYERLLEAVERDLRGRELASATFVWMQGERDARLGHGEVYGRSLRALLDRLSADLGAPDLRVVLGRLSDFDLEDARYPHWTLVRRSQENLAADDANIAWVDTDDLNDGFDPQGRPIEDDLHYSAEGYRILGERFASAALGLLRGPVRPNILLVMADDQGLCDTGYNGHPFVETPHLDRMAETGFVFDRFYAAAPVCSPTRASVLTGRSPVRTNVSNHGRYLRPMERTLAETLRDAGYVTGLFGKFHLGSAQPDSPCSPGAHGFDEWCIGLNFFDRDPFLSRNGTVESRRGLGTELVVDDALAFLERHGRGPAPTFTVVWFPSPHDPHIEEPDGPRPYEGEEAAGYYREITLLDEQFGRLRQGLRRLGAAENTILWFCSDNGGLVEATSGGRARKGSVYEGGLRVPALVEWPAGRLRGRTASPVCTSDLYPTLLSLAGVPLPSSRPLDGIDVSDLFTDPLRPRPSPIGFWHGFAPGEATWSDRILASLYERQQAGAPLPHLPERLAKDAEDFPPLDEDQAQGHGAWLDWPLKLHRIDGTRYELYDLEADPLETTDLALRESHRAAYGRMRNDLEAWMRSVVRSARGEDYPRSAAGAPR